MTEPADRPIDIFKAAAVIIRDRKLLVSRSKGKEIFLAPGGKLEAGETPLDALIRELNEEQGIIVRPADVREMGTYDSEDANRPGMTIRMFVFYVDRFEGDLQPSAEIAENRWLDSKDATTPQGSIFHHSVIPRLVAENLID